MNTEVSIGKLEVIDTKDNLTATAVGSCLVITLYDTRHRIGAMAHAMLPSYPRTAGAELKDATYINNAIDEMLWRMYSNGSKKEDIEAKLVGGANMFGIESSDIGKENVISAKKKLEKEGIKITGECVGGSMGRSVEFSVETGIVTVKTIF